MNETLGDMAKHAAVIGLLAFGYMAVFGHGWPTELRGPLFSETD